MLKTSHIQEMKRRYREMYAPKSEELEEHCGVCGEGEGIEEGKPPRKLAQRDVGMECQECGKKFRAKLSTLQYGKTKCPKCKSTDLDFAYGESVEVGESTAAYAKSLEKIARDKQLKMLTKSERDNLIKIAALLAKERKLAKEDTDKDEPGTQGDQAEYQKKRKEIAAKFGVKSCSELEGEKKKACYAALDAAHVSDDEEEDEDDDPVGKNEEVKVEESPALQMKMAASDIETYAKKHGGIDKKDMMKVASILKKGDKKGALKYTKNLDTDPRDWLLKTMGEEVELEEEVTAMDYDRLKRGDIITIEFKSAMSSGKSKFKVTAKNIVGKAKVGKVTLQNLMNPRGVKHYLYKRGNKVSFAQGDMGASVVKYTVEEVEIDEISMEAGKVYHQDTSDGKMYFKAIERQKNKRWKGLVLDIGQRKPKNGSADEKLRFWKATPDKDIPPSLKEEVETEAKFRSPRDYDDLGVGNIKYSRKKGDKKAKRKRDEEVVVDEKRGSDYELYHKTFSDAMQHAYQHAKKKGFIVDPKEIDDKVATGPKKPSSGKTNRYILKTNKKKSVHIQVANLDNKKYELNMYIEGTGHLGKVKNILERIKFKDVELEEAPSPNQAAIDRFLKGGGKIKKHVPDPKKWDKEVEKTAKWFSNIARKEKEASKKSEPSRRYVQKSTRKKKETPIEIMQHYKLPDYMVHDNIAKFPKILMGGINKIIPGVKFKNHIIAHQKWGKIPGLGVLLPGEKIPKLMIQWNQRVNDPNIDYIWADPEYAEKGTDPSTYRKNDMIVWINEAATAIDSAIKGKVDWFQRKEFEGKTPEDVAKRTLQYLKTKVKRMAKEEFVFEREMTDAEKSKREEIVLSLKKKEKDFKDRYGDKWKDVMYATATKMAMGEDVDEKKSKKKDKINLKPKMDEKMAKTYREFKKNVNEAFTAGGAEVGEQDFDVQHRLENIVSPPLGTSYKDYIDDGLEGPYLWRGDPYFLDRKVGEWYSVTAEDYVDKDTSDELHYHYSKGAAGHVKPQFSN